MSGTQVALYRSRLEGTLKGLSEALGVHVSMVIVEHALWNTRQRYEEAALVDVNDVRADLAPLEAIEPSRALAVMRELERHIVAILGRLVGKRMAEQVVGQIRNGYPSADTCEPQREDHIL